MEVFEEDLLMLLVITLIDLSVESKGEHIPIGIILITLVNLIDLELIIVGLLVRQRGRITLIGMYTYIYIYIYIIFYLYMYVCVSCYVCT